MAKPTAPRALALDEGSIPTALEDALDRWTAGGRPEQPSTVWSVDSWLKFLPDHEGLLHSLPRKISRHDVQTMASKIETSDDATEAFVTAMVWGHGRVGYGPYRTAEVLAQNPRAGDRLAELARRVRSDGGPDAFDWLVDHRLIGLGVAFATKFMFFCNGEVTTPALVLDRLVSEWFRANAGWRPDLAWNGRHYRVYIEAVARWAEALEIQPNTVELLIFQDQVRHDPASQWAAAAFDVRPIPRGASAPGPDDSAPAHIHQLLDELTDEMLELQHLTTEDVDDLRAHVRALRRIAIASTLSIDPSTVGR